MSVICPVCDNKNNENDEYCRHCDATLVVAKGFGFIEPKEIEKKIEKEIEIEIEREIIEESGAETVQIVDQDQDFKASEDKNHNVRNSKEDELKNSEKNRTHHNEYNNLDLNEYKKTTRNETDTFEGDAVETDGSWIKLNHLACPFCGHLNKQNQFFCQRCGCDLKYAKTVKVPAGRIDSFQVESSKAIARSLVGASGQSGVLEDFKKLQLISKNSRLNLKTWRQGTEMSIEVDGFTFNKATIMVIGVAYFLVNTVLDDIDVFWPLILAVTGFKIYKKYVEGDKGDTIILNEEGVEIWNQTGRENDKLRDIEWDDVDQLAIIGKGKNMTLNLQSTDQSKSCKLPEFSAKKRAMILNTFGIIANKNKYEIYFDKDHSSSDV